MKTKRQLFWAAFFTAIVIGAGMVVSDRAAAQAAANREDVEVMTRGPVHEAFAEAVVFDPKPGIIVSKPTPALIEEIQPDQRPVGDNVAWIPGYWAWDEEQNDFLWISGVWRNLPPGREWVPGYWAQVDTGYQWTSGYWQDAQTEEVTYLPEPPRSVETGPSSPSTSDDQTWIPGTWQYQDDHYAWRTGYWVTARPNWCWIPSYYRWTSCGYVYVDGYWDYPVVNRGVIFAPVRFRSSYYSWPYYYTPFATIGLSVFYNHLFIRPNYCHYYFGDYYDWGYRGNYYASYAYGSRYRGGYDPIFAYSRWENRGDRNWYRGREDYFAYRRDNLAARPPRTWEALNRLPERDRVREDFGFAERYDRVVGSRDGITSRFQAVSTSERERFASQRTEIRNFARERQQREVSANRVSGDRTGRVQASSVKVSRSPVVARTENRSEKSGGPPARLERKVSGNRVIASTGDRTAKESNGGRTAVDRTTTDAGQTANRGGADIARSEVLQNRESRTKPGQRREEVKTAERKTQSTAEGIARRDTSPTSKAERTETSRRVESSPSSRGNSEFKRETTPADRTREKPQVSSERVQPEKQRVAPPQGTRRETSEPQREAAPQSERKLAKPEVRTESTRQVAPSSRSTTAPVVRQPNADQIRQSTPRVAPQSRTQQNPVPRVQPQREQVYRPQPRVTQPMQQPQRTQVAPQRQAVPQRQQMVRPQRQAMPQRQEMSRPQRQAIPQRQTVRPQSSAPRQQAAQGRTSESPKQSSGRRNDKAER